MKLIALYITAFITGMNIMILELLASRILAPYAGTSLNVWASLIGIVLASLSIGYFLGGYLADKYPTFKFLANILFFTFVSIIYILFFRNNLLIFISSNFFDIRVVAIIGTVLLFSPASILFGIITPYVVRLHLNDVKAAGSTVGLVSALSTLGSILGTFLAGFVLLAYFDISTILILLSSLVLCSIVLVSFLAKYNKFLAVYFLCFMVIPIYYVTRQSNGVIEINTPYNNVRIFDNDQVSDRGTVRMLFMGQVVHSMIFLHSKELASEYAKYYQLIEVFNPDFKHVLMIGGGAYSFPNFFIQHYADATIDVVEIDPKLTDIAKKYFFLKQDPRLTIYHEDGRIFLNRSQEKYDAIFNDSFSSYYSVPFQLTTVEAVEKMYKSLTDKGLIITNIVSSISGRNSKFFQAEYATYSKVFPYVYLYTVRTDNTNEVQNLILVASKRKKPNEQMGNHLQLLVDNQWYGKVESTVPILTDDFAPVDTYILSYQDK